MKRVLSLLLMVAMVATCGVLVAADDGACMHPHLTGSPVEDIGSPTRSDGCLMTQNARFVYTCDDCGYEYEGYGTYTYYDHSYSVVAETCNGSSHVQWYQCSGCSNIYDYGFTCHTDCPVYLMGGGWR